MPFPVPHGFLDSTVDEKKETGPKRLEKQHMIYIYCRSTNSFAKNVNCQQVKYEGGPN